MENTLSEFQTGALTLTEYSAGLFVCFLLLFFVVCLVGWVFLFGWFFVCLFVVVLFFLCQSLKPHLRTKHRCQRQNSTREYAAS